MHDMTWWLPRLILLGLQLLCVGVVIGINIGVGWRWGWYSVPPLTLITGLIVFVLVRQAFRDRRRGPTGIGP